MYLLVILLLINYAQTQQDICSCSCCIGEFCSPTVLGTFDIRSCTIEACRLQCRTSFAQCQADYPNGQVLPQCLSYVSPSYNCRCDCCNTGSTTCIPIFVGYSTAYVCQSSACSISCTTQYPSQCVSNQNGQTIGTCTGPITTTATTISTTTVSRSTNSLWIGHTCSCMCCQSGPNCSPNIEVGITTTSQCSSLACTTACQNQYPSVCPLVLNLGQTNGTCISQSSGNTRCQCQCCGTNGCPTYEINTNGDCTSCYTLCQRQSLCGNTNTVTYSCTTNKSKISVEISLSLIIFISIIVLQ
ncbi:unnamed protein product [Rotaria sordida]|uniref:Uncharacterized protein n=1 Tax=Rotaria sordida TaxID=392033 RepID=A0A815JV09_9BILA|nr:unnamed protein product [Rotaria sordida]CAF1112014.1 unnamed protein product [Rotaria sordida]CAF1148342.1 unnamed protein product [Rotaria sordida]CAF1384776.1 unnamed protein product [Rotaria sordida]CAF3641562.1 unnamed protein product [Rotaria sordida]